MSGTISTATTHTGFAVGASNQNPTQPNTKEQLQEDYYALASQEDSDAQYGDEEEEYEESSPSVSDDQLSSSSIGGHGSDDQDYENEPIIKGAQRGSLPTDGGQSSSFFEQGITENEDSFIVCLKQAEKQREGSLGDRNSVL